MRRLVTFALQYQGYQSNAAISISF